MTDVPLQTKSASSITSLLVVRIGAYVLVGGFGLTTLGAVLLAQGPTSFELAADFVHRFGMISMLVGLIVLLFGYRMPVLFKLWKKIQESKKMWTQESDAVEMSGERKISGAETPAPVNMPMLVNGILVCAAMAVFASLLLLMAPLQFALLVAAWVNLLLPSMLTVTAVQCRGYVRTFCIAALFPAGFALYATVTLMPMLILGRGGFGWNSGAYGGGFGGAGGSEGMEWRVSAFIQWGLVIVIGAIGVGLHFFLEACRVSPRTRGDRSWR